jgi:hypothetical protein
VGRINGAVGQDPTPAGAIGVLDIYGFECFKSNDFEQLCINLANEKLQQHFNAHVFKREQAEYADEGIDWAYIEFVDNQDVLDLIEKRPLGILDCLDEACRFPRATAADFANKLASTPAITGSARFSTPKREPGAFTIAHYAGDVTYRTDAFSSGDAGPLGWVEAGQWRPLRANGAGGQWAQLALPDAALWPRVEVVFSHAGQDGAVVRALMASPTERPAGWVVAGTGNGTIHHELVRALQQAQAMGCRVLRTTRCAEGRVLGEHGDWPVTPVTSPYKARIGLMLELLAAPDAAAPGLERPHMAA